MFRELNVDYREVAMKDIINLKPLSYKLKRMLINAFINEHTKEQAELLGIMTEINAMQFIRICSAAF